MACITIDSSAENYIKKNGGSIIIARKRSGGC